MISTKYTYDVNKPEFREGEYSYTHPDMQETMWSSIPLDLANTQYVENIHRVSSLELERISAALDVVKRNMFLAVADDNGLNLWEQYTGLPPEIIEITSELRRRYLQAKMTGRHYFLGYHFTEGLELIGGPIRQIYYDPVAVEARILFKEPLTDPQLAKIEYFCGKVGPAHIRWSSDSPGAGNGWVVSKFIEYCAPWLRSDTTLPQEDEYLHENWADLSDGQCRAYCQAALDDWNEFYKDLKEDELDMLFPDNVGGHSSDNDKPEWLKSFPGPADEPPPRFGEYI